MGKETRIGVGVVGVLVVISAALLYGRLSRDTGLPIELNVDAGSGAVAGQNEVPKQPTIEQSPSTYRPTRPISPAPLRATQEPNATGRSFLLDTNPSPVPDSMRDLTIPDYERGQPSRFSSPVTSPAISPIRNARDASPTSPASPDRQNVRVSRGDVDSRR